MVPVEPPHSIAQARVDDKGRLKLPAEFLEYLKKLGVDKVFITTLDRQLARIYPISVWRVNEKVLEQLATEDPDASDSLAFVSNDYGAEAKVDPQGRITLPTDLRRALAIENQEVRLDCTQNAINVYSKAEYEARKRQSREKLADKLKAAKLKGFK